MSASTWPGPDRGQLVDVADQDHGGARRHGPHAALHQRHVDHRGLVDDEQVACRAGSRARAGSCRRPGSTSSSRWMVFASRPGASVRRLAARPVGAQSVTRTRLAPRIARMARTIVVLPTPGPPVMTSTFDAMAWRTASRCRPPARGQLLLDPRERLLRVDGRPGRRAQPPAPESRRPADAPPCAATPGRCSRGPPSRRPPPCPRRVSAASAASTIVARHLEQLLRRARPVPRAAGRSGPRRSPASARRRCPPGRGSAAVFSMPSFCASASAVRKPMPRMSRASR